MSKPENVKCPECQGPMVVRTSRKNGAKFWGCAKYPECTGTRDTDGMSRQEREEERNKLRDKDDTDEFRWDRNQ